MTIVALSSVCLFLMRRQQAQFSYMTSITNTNDKIELNVCLNTDAFTNKSIIVIIKDFPLIILLSRNVSSPQRSFPLKGHNTVMAAQEAKQPVLVVFRSMAVFVNK